MSILAAATVDRQGGCGRGGSRSRGERMLCEFSYL